MESMFLKLTRFPLAPKSCLVPGGAPTVCAQLNVAGMVLVLRVLCDVVFDVIE